MAEDFALLYIHVTILILIIVKEYSKPKNRNIFAIAFCGAFLVLVSGQNWWMLNKFDTDDLQEMTHLFQSVSRTGLRWANFYIGIAVIFYGFSYWLFGNRNSNALQINYPRSNSKASLNVFSYGFLTLWVFVVAALLIRSAGGIEASLANPGLNQEYGVTMFLILLSIGKYIVFSKITSGDKILLVDIIIFAVVVFLLLFNARLNIGLLIIQMVILINYCRYEIPRRALLLVPISIFVVFIVFGLYREFATHAGGEITFALLSGFYTNYFDIELLLNWFYSANVEAFAGLAGILTYNDNVGGLYHDLGLSNLSFITQFIPGGIKNDPSLPFLDLTNAFYSLYPYRGGSLIPSGLEMAFGNFGFLGIILFGTALGYITQFLHKAMSNQKQDRLKIGILSVQILHVIRGPFSNVIFFALADLIILSFYRFVVSIFKHNTTKKIDSFKTS